MNITSMYKFQIVLYEKLQLVTRSQQALSGASVTQQTHLKTRFIKGKFRTTKRMW
jgi:hypothetical protein